MATTTRRDRLVSQASADALLRYGDELSGLRELLTSSRAQYTQRVRSAQAGAAGIQAAVAQALPQLKGVYGDGPTAGIPGLSRAQALDDMIGRGVSAQESVASSRRTAAQNLRSDEAQILGRRQDIAQQIGAFETSEVGKLGQQAAQRDLSNRISLRNNQTRQSEGALNRQNARQIARIRTAGKGTRKPASPAAHQHATTQLGQALAALRTLDPHRDSANRREVGGLLVSGKPAERLLDPATGKQRVSRGGVPLATPAVPRIEQPFATAALDAYYNGNLSRQTQDHLHRLGYSVRDLGLPSYAQRRPARPRRQPPAPSSNFTGAVANAISGVTG